MLRFDNGHNYLEMSVEIDEDNSLQSYGDAAVSIRVHSHGFSGNSDFWVFRNVLESFCSSLIALEHAQEGEAFLESISPNELNITIRTLSSSGNFAVVGTTGHMIYEKNSKIWHSVSFGFEFEPSQMHEVFKLPWVKRYGTSTISTG